LIGVVITSHGNLARELYNSARLIVGDQPQVETVALQEAETPASLIQRLNQAVEAVDRGQGALVLADLLGGTPANASLRLVGNPRVACLTGANLAMVLEALTERDRGMDLGTLAERCAEAGQRGIRDLGQVADQAANSR